MYKQTSGSETWNATKYWACGSIPRSTRESGGPIVRISTRKELPIEVPYLIVKIYTKRQKKYL